MSTLSNMRKASYHAILDKLAIAIHAMIKLGTSCMPNIAPHTIASFVCQDTRKVLFCRILSCQRWQDPDITVTSKRRHCFVFSCTIHPFTQSTQTPASSEHTAPSLSATRCHFRVLFQFNTVTHTHTNTTCACDSRKHIQNIHTHAQVMLGHPPSACVHVFDDELGILFVISQLGISRMPHIMFSVDLPRAIASFVCQDTQQLMLVTFCHTSAIASIKQQMRM